MSNEEDPPPFEFKIVDETGKEIESLDFSIPVWPFAVSGAAFLGAGFLAGVVFAKRKDEGLKGVTEAEAAALRGQGAKLAGKAFLLGTTLCGVLATAAVLGTAKWMGVSTVFIS